MSDTAAISSRRKRRPRRPAAIEVEYAGDAEPRLNSFGSILRSIERFARDHFDLTGRWPTRVRITLGAHRDRAERIELLQEREAA